MGDFRPEFDRTPSFTFSRDTGIKYEGKLAGALIFNKEVCARYSITCEEAENREAFPSN